MLRPDENFRNGFSDRNLGYSLLFSVFLLIVAVRQTLLDIYPRPGHEYIGSAVLGLHMPVWSILIATTLITAFAIKLCVIGTEDGSEPPERRSGIGRLAMLLSLYVIAVALINFWLCGRAVRPRRVPHDGLRIAEIAGAR